MNVLVLGASGAVGTHVVRLLSDTTHNLTAAYRSEPPHVSDSVNKVVRPDIFSEESIRSLVADKEAIICAVGMRFANSANPFSKLLSPPTLVGDLMQLIVEHATTDTRLVWVSGGGVGESRPALTPFFRWFVDVSRIGPAYEDLARAEGIVHSSQLRWTTIRPTTLTNGKGGKPVREVDKYSMRTMITREDVARSLIEAAESDKWLREAPMIANG